VVCELPGGGIMESLFLLEITMIPVRGSISNPVVSAYQLLLPGTWTTRLVAPVFRSTRKISPKLENP
jgi:hypothetical protein